MSSLLDPHTTIALLAFRTCNKTYASAFVVQLKAQLLVRANNWS